MTPRTRRWLVGLALGLILLAGFCLRTFNVDWAEGQLPHPDERSTIAFYAPSIRWPTEPGTFFDPRRSTLNPLWDVSSNSRRSYTYGHFPLYLLVVAGHLTQKLAPVAETIGAPQEYVDMMRIAVGSPGYAWVGRLMMAIADTITLLYLFLIGRRVYNKHVGLLAAALGAFTVLQIQLAHFFAVDPISTTFTVAAIYHAIRMVDTRGWKQTVITGVMAGLAIACKFSALPILAAPGVAGLILWWNQRGSGAIGQASGREESAGKRYRGIILAASAIGIAVVAFVITSPFVLLDWKNFDLAVIKEQGAMVRGIADFPFTRQYRGTTPYLYFIVQQIRWGMGWFLGLVGWLAFGWAILKTLMLRAKVGELIILSWLVPYFLITGSFLAKFNRYMVPVVPLLAVLGAGMLWSLAGWIVRRRSTTGDQGDEAIAIALPPATPIGTVPAEEAEAISPLQPASSDAASDVGPVAQLLEPAPEQIDERPAKFAGDRLRPLQMATTRLFWIFGLIVFIPTMLWGLAFVNGVYNHEHTFITASKWMYENVPDGSVWITEHWEEGMPLVLPIPGGNPGEHGWRNVSMPMYEEDTPEKFQILKQNMTEGDYYVLATKRLYGALPKLPQRYPMSLKFYDLLFSGQLGYELAAEFTAYPSLLGIDIPDQAADESFWVYDHPRVLIYKKVRDLSDAEWNQLLGGSWEGAVYGYTGQKSEVRDQSSEVSQGETGPDLLLDQPVNTLPDVGRVAWNPFRYNSWLSLIFWWLVLFGVQILAWPIAFTLFGSLRDRGYGFSRALALILLAWLAWILPALHILKNNLLPPLIAVLVVLVLSVALWRRNREAMRTFWRGRRRLILISEGVFTAAFLLFVFIRLLNPDLWQPWQGGEKFMEFAFLNAVTRTPFFPAYDPYFAGGYLNYYYYGYQILSVLIKLTGISASIAFNLAIPTLFALTAAGVFSLVYTLVAGNRKTRRPEDQDTRIPGYQETGNAGDGGAPAPASMASYSRRGVWAGLAGVFFVAMMGNLEGGLIILRQLAERSGSLFNSNIPLLQPAVQTLSGIGAAAAGRIQWPGYNFWTPSRVLPFTINEFPFWSFLFADLHPHMIGIPFTVLFLALAFSLIAGYRRSESDTDETVLERSEGSSANGAIEQASGGCLPLVLLFAVLPLTLGAIGAINTWDLPTYLGVGVLAWGMREWKGYGKLRIVPTLLFVVGLAAASYLLYLPFYRNYTTVFDTGVGLTYVKTQMGAWLRIWGFFLFVVLTYVLVELRRRPGDVPVLRWLAGLLGHFDRAPRYLDHVSALAHPRWTLRFGQAVLGISIVLGVVLAFLGYSVVGLLLPLVVITALYLFRRTTSAPSQFRALLFFTGLLVVVGVEIFYLKDFLCGCGDGGLLSRQHGDYYRMNTLFKFYIQVWVLLGIGAAAALPGLIDAARSWKRGWRSVWMATLGILLALGLVFPILGTANRVNDRFPPPVPARNTLDGMAFMTVGRYGWPDGNNMIDLKYDYEAIRWLKENVTGTPVLAEAPASWYPVNGQNAGYDYYRAGGLRASSLTGLPTFLGQHQGEQRFGSQTGPREAVGREFFETTDIARLRQIIDELGVDYVYIGQLERILFNADQLRKFDALVDLGEAEVVFQNDGVTIYRLE